MDVIAVVIDRMIAHEYPADWTSATIYPVFDVHVGAPEFDGKAFERYLQTVKDDPRGLVVLGGDLMDNATKGSVGSAYEATISPKEQKKLIIKLLDPVRDKIIGAVSGNHCRRTSRESGQDIMGDVCAMLGVEHKYRESTAYLKLKFGAKRGHSGNGNPVVYSIILTHGAGGGMYMGGSVNKTENYLIGASNIDIMITGHVHKIGATRPARINADLRNEVVTLDDMANVICGSWMQYGGYAAQKLLRPGSMGAPRIVLDGTRKAFEAVV